MASNTYKLPDNQGLFSWLEKFLKMDQTISQVIHVRFMPQILFITALSIIYIANRHYAEKKIRNITQLENEVNDLRADYTSLKADYMYASKQSEVAKMAAKLGLRESKIPPYKITAEEK